jgi:fatty-acyl-CoA synthase
MPALGQFSLSEALRNYSQSGASIGFDFIDAVGNREHVTASDLWREATKWAAAFSTRGVMPGDRVALSIDRVDMFVYAFWGCHLIAAVPTTLAPFEKQARVEEQRRHIRRVVAITRPRLVVIESPFITADELNEPDLEAPVIEASDIATCTMDAFAGCDTDPGAVALIQFTSGSTQAPKGCALSHIAIVRNARAILERGGGQAGDVNIHWVPLSHDMGLMGAVVVPVVGQHSSVIMHPKRFMMRPLAWLEELALHHDVHTSVPNFALRMVTRRANRLQLSAESLSGVKNIICGAEAINPDDVRAFFEAFGQYGLPRRSFHASYGMAEATVMATSRPGGLKTLAASDREPGSDGLIDQREYVSVGSPVAGAEIRIMDECGVRLGDGVAGEIELRSACAMTEYFRDAVATAQKIVDGWLRTGDIGFMSDGDLYIAGRRSDLLIVAGRNIYPTDIEPAIADNLGIDPRKVAVFSAEGPHGTEELFVLIEHLGANTQKAAVSAVSRICQSICGVVPASIIFRKSGTIPKTTSGKIKRPELRMIYSNDGL